MENYDTAPVSDIESVGLATQAKLATIGIYLVPDLVRVTSASLQNSFPGRVSRKRVNAWRSMAFLLAVREITPQLAEALVWSGIESVEKLSRADLPEVREIFQEARVERIIPRVPTQAQITRILVDATLIDSTGSLSGTVRDTAGLPLAGAEVRIARLTTITDERGRFRVWRVPLGRSPILTIRHPGFQTLTIREPRITIDTEAIALQAFRLNWAVEEAVEAGEALSELEGDVLPPMSGLPVRTEWLSFEALPDGDIVLLRKFYVRRPEAQMVSRFRAYQDGEIIVHAYRVPVAALPSEAAKRAHFRYRNGEFKPFVATPGRMHAELRRRRFLKSNPPPTPFGTVERLSAYLRSMHEYISAV